MDDITHTVLAVVMLYGAYRWGRVAGELSNRSRALSTLLENLLFVSEEQVSKDLKELQDLLEEVQREDDDEQKD
jgi:hypothetical protein